jgi:hypothetical protein
MGLAGKATLPKCPDGGTGEVLLVCAFVRPNISGSSFSKITISHEYPAETESTASKFSSKQLYSLQRVYSRNKVALWMIATVMYGNHRLVRSYLSFTINALFLIYFEDTLSAMQIRF